MERNQARKNYDVAMSNFKIAHSLLAVAFEIGEKFPSAETHEQYTTAAKNEDRHYVALVKARQEFGRACKAERAAA